MRSPFKFPAGAWLGLALLGNPVPKALPAEPVGAALQQLALGARAKNRWPGLRKFAGKAQDPEQKGLAYFVLGYREYEADVFGPASEDLARAAETEFSLSDFAEYYRAAAAEAAKEPNRAARILDGFELRHPQSLLGGDALQLLARALLETRQYESAVKILTASPQLPNRPPLLLALGRAYFHLGKYEEAVGSFQQVYYLHPLSREVREAGQELDQSRARLGSARFTAPTAEMRADRAQALFAHGRYREALKEYAAALADYPEGSSVPGWKIGRARCLLHLRRSEEALDALEKPFPKDPAADAERLATLVEAYARRDNPESMTVVLTQLGAVYPNSPAYASALEAAGRFYVRQNDWKSASPYYRSLAESFPIAQQAQEASWRIGWALYLARDRAGARRAFVAHLTNYPQSPHAPDALYWLGRLAESEGAASEAGELYAALLTRFPHNYFRARASDRLKFLPRSSSSGPNAPSSAWAAVTELEKNIPPPAPPPAEICKNASSSALLRPVEIFELLDLGDLAEAYLRNLLTDTPSPAPDVYLVLSRLEAKHGAFNKSLLDGDKAIPEFSEYDFSRLPREVWSLLFPRAFWDTVRLESVSRGLDPYMVMGLIRQESAFNPKAISTANARGLMQILPRTASPRRSRRRAEARRLADAAYNVRFGSLYFKKLVEDYGGVLEYALAAYNAGKLRVDDWLRENKFQEPAEFLESIPIPATRIYVERVLRDGEIYRGLMQGNPAFRRCP